MRPTNSFIKPPQQQLNDLLEYYQHKRFNEAEKLSLSIIKEFPRNQLAWKILHAVLRETDRINESLFAAQKSVELEPKNSEVHNNLGATLRKLGRLEEAMASYRKAILLKPDFTSAHLNLGATLQQLGKLEQAEASYRKAILLKPDFASHFNLGVTLKNLGKLEEAEANFQKAISLKPDFAHAHRFLTMIKKYNSKDEQYLKMKELYLDEKISEVQRCSINFALAKAHDDLGDFEQAFKHYNEGNTFFNKQFKYDVNKDIEVFNELKINYPQIKKNSPNPKILINKLRPIFIVGMPRSGTTLVEQIISSHSKVSGAGELPFVREFGEGIARGLSNSNTDSLLKFRKKYLNKLQYFSNNKSIVTDKLPHNFLFIGMITAVFPEAKIVHVIRNPAAVCWSNYKKYFQSKNMSYSYTLDNIIKYYELYKDIMIFWNEQLPNKIFNINYELLTVNQEKETRKLIDYLSLDWEEKCLSPQDNMRGISTASDIQVRKKVYQGSSQQWEKYKPFLNGVFDYFN